MFNLKHLFITITVFLYAYLFINYQLNIKQNQKIIVNNVCNELKQNNVTNKFIKQYYKILSWTKLWSHTWNGINLIDLNCQYSNCNLTSNRNQLNSSDAVLFHLRDTKKQDVPAYHIPNQSWVLFNLEPPYYAELKNALAIENETNWVMSYRHDSDIYVPYGRIVKCAPNRWKAFKHLFRSKKSKVKNIAWMVSNCNTTSKREDYVRALSKHIDVDIYGKCGTMACVPKFSAGCMEHIAKKYRFYLSFENSFCKDYVTEKLFAILKYDIIPVVYGSANYEQIMPKNSYIDANKFQSPQHLATFLRSVAKNQTKYNSYFQWKDEYCVEETSYFNEAAKYFCDVCKKLNTESNGNDNTYKVKPNLMKWLSNDAMCFENNKHRLFI